MPAMFIEREGGIPEDEWQRAVVACGGRIDGAHAELVDDDGTFRRVLNYRGGCAEFSMMSYCRPFIDQIDRIAGTLGAYVIDNDGARY